MLNRSTDIWSRLAEVLGADNLDEMAHKLGLNASTLRGRKAREAIPYEQIICNLDVYDLAYVFKDKKIDKSIDLSNIVNHKDIEEGNLNELEQYFDELIQTIEKGPFSTAFKIRVYTSLIRNAADDELKTFRKKLVEYQ